MGPVEQFKKLARDLQKTADTAELHLDYLDEADNEFELDTLVEYSYWPGYPEKADPWSGATPAEAPELEITSIRDEATGNLLNLEGFNLKEVEEKLWATLRGEG